MYTDLRAAWGRRQEERGLDFTPNRSPQAKGQASLQMGALLSPRWANLAKYGNPNGGSRSAADAAAAGPVLRLVPVATLLYGEKGY